MVQCDIRDMALAGLSNKPSNGHRLFENLLCDRSTMIATAIARVLNVVKLNGQREPLTDPNVPSSCGEVRNVASTVDTIRRGLEISRKGHDEEEIAL